MHTLSAEYGIALVFLTTIVVSWIVIPAIVRTAKHYKLLSQPNGRTSHNGGIPALGGVGIFIAVILGSLLFMQDPDFREFRYILAAMAIIFFIGVKDDLMDLAWPTKVVAEILAAFLLVVIAGVRITTFHGLFGIGELPVGWSIASSMFVCICLINCFNLLDGIDGLASGLSIFIALVFGFWLYLLGLTNFAILAFALAGSLVPFLLFNVYGKKNKLFMGDCGSLTLGFLFSVLAIKILCCEMSAESALSMKALPAVVMGIMIMPMVDTLRVFVTRILKGGSPFKADRTHLHHILLDLRFSHKQAAATIILINICLAAMTYALRDLDPTLVTVILFGSALIISLIPAYLLRYQSGRKKTEVQQSV